jgi:hypothetical protein
MKLFKILLTLIMVVTLTPIGMQAQTFDLQFVEMLNDGTNFDVKVQIKSNGSTFGLGNSNLVFDFDSSTVSSPALQTTHNFSGTFYNTMALTTIGVIGKGRVSLNIELFLPNFGTTVPLTYLDVATVRFTIEDPTGNPSLQWRTVVPNRTNVFMDDQATEVTAGTLNNYETPLPIQLASLSAIVVNQNEVRVDWTTLTETNNYGFEVQKSADSTNDYQTIPNSFVPGHGTTVQPHSYSYTDVTASSGFWFYRLKQIDLDGTVHYTDGVQVDVTTGVEEKPIPTVFALDQNYPNPFNPSTVIEFAIPQETHVKLEVYNMIGQRVATLADGVRPAGYYSVLFDATGLASGVYVYRFQAEDPSPGSGQRFVETKKLLFLK